MCIALEPTIIFADRTGALDLSRTECQEMTGTSCMEYSVMGHTLSIGGKRYVVTEDIFAVLYFIVRIISHRAGR